MKIPPGMSATVTHNMIIADRSEVWNVRGGHNLGCLPGGGWLYQRMA